MIEGVKSFQKEQGLKVDGVMKTDGSTINRLNQELSMERIKFHTAANDRVGNRLPDKKPVQLAGGPVVWAGIAALNAIRAAPMVGKALVDGARVVNTAAATKNFLEQQKKRNKHRVPEAANDPYAQSKIPDPLPQIPALTPPNQEKISKVGIAWSPGIPHGKPQIGGFPSDLRQKVEPVIFEALSEEARLFLNGALENRRGSPVTIEGNGIAAEVVEELVKELPNDIRDRFKHTGGGYDKDGKYLKEEYRRSYGALHKKAGQRNSSYADLTFTFTDPGGKRRRHFRLNTGNTLKDRSTPVIRERRELYNMRRNGELGDTADFLPKLRASMDREEYRRRLRPIIREKFFRFIAEQLK
jgi:hypothetical protein